MTTNRVAFFRETNIFTSGMEGYHTFRIPSLIIAPDGSILAICEGRKHGRDDFHAMYLVMKRSKDNGVTWDNLKVLTGNEENTHNNPTVLVDTDTDTIWLAYCLGAFYIYIMNSNNNGKTWSKPMNITNQVKSSNWTQYDLGPGHGIQLKNGTLIIPGDHKEGLRHDWIFSHSHIIYSNDHGNSWHIGGSIAEATNECQVVETKGGGLYMTIRTARRNDKCRYYSRSNDAGMTWSAAIPQKGFPDPTCQASIIQYTNLENHDKSRLILANLNSTETRDNITLRLSYDEGVTWPISKTLYSGPSAYSDLAISSDMMINCLYERDWSIKYNKSLRLAQFNLEWLTDGKDSLKL